MVTDYCDLGKPRHWSNIIVWVLAIVVVVCLMWQKRPTVVGNEPNDIVIVERNE